MTAGLIPVIVTITVWRVVKSGKPHCDSCPQLHQYPQSLFFDNSYKNYEDKRKAFTGHSNLTIVTPSHWAKRPGETFFFERISCKSYSQWR